MYPHGPGRLSTSCDEIDGWKIAHDRTTCEQQGHVLKIHSEVMPARLGAMKLPKGSPNLKPKYGSLYKPPFTEYWLTLDGRTIVRGSSYVCEAAIFEYFRRERVVPDMTYPPKNENIHYAGPHGKARMGGVPMMATLMALTMMVEQQDPREVYREEDEIPDEFREQYAQPNPEAPKDEEVPF